MSDCLFCAIAAGAIPADVVWSDDEFVAFRDIAAQAPTHVLVIPRRHVSNAAELAATEVAQLGRLVQRSTEVAGRLGIADGGYRFVMNTGPQGGQTVDHVHVHVLGGRQMQWPPG